MDLQSVEGNLHNQAEIKTYSVYNNAWCIRKSSEDSVSNAQLRLDHFQRLQPTPPIDFEIVLRHLRRGLLTLELMQLIPVDDWPELAMASTLWLPVQTYYAAHGLGLSFLAAIGGSASLPKSHGGFLKVAREAIVERLLPEPFSAVLDGGYRGWKNLPGNVAGIPHSTIQITPGLNIRSPSEDSRDSNVAQCLNTTRAKLINEKLNRARAKACKPGKMRGRLSKDQQLGIALSVAPTTVFDYLYRARRKSNYEDVTMFQENSDHADTLLDLAKSTLELAEVICQLLANSLWRVLDDPARKIISSQTNFDSIFEQGGH